MQLKKGEITWKDNTVKKMKKNERGMWSFQPKDKKRGICKGLSGITDSLTSAFLAALYSSSFGGKPLQENVEIQHWLWNPKMWCSRSHSSRSDSDADMKNYQPVEIKGKLKLTQMQADGKPAYVGKWQYA